MFSEFIEEQNMLDSNNRMTLIQKLRGKIKKASSNISSRLEVEKGDFRISLTADSIDQFYKGKQVGSVKLSQLDPELVELINSDEDAGQEMLEEFASTFDPSGLSKEAANDAVDEETATIITQKQLDDKKVKLHPRKDEYPNTVTQKQLPDAGQRPGTYDEITQAQLTNERNTFYGDSRISGDWKQEDRNTVTESQLDEDAKKFSELGESNRGEMGAKFDGGVDKQNHMIGEKQLEELLSHHEWKEPFTTTEGKEQLGKQNGELARLTAENAVAITKMATEALGKTVLATGAIPSRLNKIINKLVSHNSKYPVLANVISKFKGAPINAIEDKIANAKYFGKTANANAKYSDSLVANVFVRQLAAAASYNPTDTVKVLAFLAKEANFENRIDEGVSQVLSSANTKTAENDSDFDVIKSALYSPVVKGDASEDGMYFYAGHISEVNENPKNKDKFAEAAAKYAETKIREATKVAVELVPFDCAVHEDKEVFEVRFQDSSFIKPELEVRAAKRREMAKEASNKKEAQMPGGGMPPAGGPAMGNPQVPPTGPDMGGAPPGEALSQTPPPMGEEGMDSMEGDGEPKPPGSICPACGSKDVNIEAGDFKCNNCGTAGNLHVTLDITKWTGTIEDSDKQEGGVGMEDVGGLGAEEAGMAESTGGTPAAGEGGGTTLPSMPIAASIKITPFVIQKLAEQKINFGKVCPNCGSNNADSVKSASRKGNDCICWDCLQEWNFQVKMAKNKKNSVFAQSTWIPKNAQSCSGCERLSSAFKQSLNNYGMEWNAFDKLSMLEQAKVVVKMAESNTLDIGDAMLAPLPINKYAASARWKGYEKFDKFPSASCVERISRRYGENATAMSGPCKGAKLANCVCSQLETLGIYSDGLAAKVASAVSNPDPVIHNPTETCAQMLIRSGFQIKEACVACDGLRAAYATSEDLIIEAIANINPVVKTAQMIGADIGAGIGNAVGGIARGVGQGIGGAAQGVGQGAGGLAQGLGGGVGQAAQGVGRAVGQLPKPLEADPVSDGGEPSFGEPKGSGELSLELGGDMGSDMGGDLGGDIGGGDLDLGLGGDVVTIELPGDMVETLKTLLQAIQGQIGDDMIDTTGDGLGGDDLGNGFGESEELGLGSEDSGDPLDVGSVTDGTVEGGEEELDIPGTSVGDDGGLEKDGDPEEESKECPCAMEKPHNEHRENRQEFRHENHERHEEPREESHEDHEEPREESHEDHESHESHEDREDEPRDLPFTDKTESKEDDHEKGASLRDMLYRMKTGTISKSASAMDSLVEGLLKQAKKTSDDVVKVKKSEETGSKLSRKPAQESSDIGKIQDGGKIGGEKPFKDGVKDKPDVPRGDALMGEEDSDKKLNEKENLPKIPHGKGLMDGEEHYKPQDGNVIDGNQGAQHAASSKPAIKTASCKCGSSACKCDCNSKSCGNPCKKESSSKNNEKLASNIKDNQVKMANADKPKDVNMSKEAQTAKLKNIKKLEDDPDINQSSGPGKGKVKGDETHSLAVDEKKPSEGMSEPSVPEAPNAGRLTREHTVEKAKDGPEIPTGGGMNPEYDKNDKNKPEKTDEILGKQNNVALAEHRNKAMKIAGQLLKSNKITIDDFPNKVAELVNSSATILEDYENFLVHEASKSSDKGMQKAAQSGTIENIPVQQTAPNVDDKKGNLKNNIEGLFTLQRRNKDFERYSEQYGK